MPNTSDSNFDFDEMRRLWRSQSFTGVAGEGGTDPARLRRAGAFSEQLAARFMTFGLIGLAFSVIIWPLNHVMQLPLWLMIWMSVFFLVMGVMNILFRRYILRIKFGSMPLTEAVVAVVALKRAEMMRLIVGICLAVPLLSAMLWTFFGTSVEMFEGGLIGLVIGSVIGYREWQRDRWFIRKMHEALS